MIVWKQNFHQNLFFYKSISLQNLMRCKDFFFEIWHVLKFSIRNLSSCEKTVLSLTHLKFLIQNMTCCTTNDSKLNILKHFDPKIFYKGTKQLFPEQLFHECTKKPTLKFLSCKLTRQNILWERVFQQTLIF